MRVVTLITISATIALTGCAGKVDYIQPTKQAPASNVKVVNKPRNDVWNSSVPELGKQFFVINNLDKSSGLINISYSGDPESYIDCGKVTSYVKNVRGERTYDFAGSKAQQTYEVMNDFELFIIDRKMDLEGRVNLIFEEVSPNSTRVTANTKYIVSRSLTIQSSANNIQQSLNNSVSFNSGGSASFPATADGRATECVPTGRLERDILSAIK
ncbi:MAG: hypothetical protein J4A00_06380 [Gammaproteobacteria bacterium]|nr:hypothetical protein [Gammaproteobacteria bacterium]